MPRLVDGDNFLGSVGSRRSDAARRDLVRSVERLSRLDGRRILLVFDGSDPGPPHLCGNCRFSGKGRSADDLILEILTAEDDRAGWIVVTNDRSLGDQCRWLGAKVERCQQFRQRLEAKSCEDKPDAVGDVDEWLRVFGSDPGGSRSR